MKKTQPTNPKGTKPSKKPTPNLTDTFNHVKTSPSADDDDSITSSKMEPEKTHR
jgi:hypothetical protein